jgi:hypothetical protein
MQRSIRSGGWLIMNRPVVMRSAAAQTLGTSLCFFGSRMHATVEHPALTMAGPASLQQADTQFFQTFGSCYTSAYFSLPGQGVGSARFA